MQEAEDVLLAFSVLGLSRSAAAGGSPPAEARSLAAGGRGSFGLAGREQSVGRKGGWLSSFNTVVAGGDRQERAQEIVL